jgi:hypothetical protein
LRAIGVPASEVEATITSLYNEMTMYTRKLRRLELEAQLNRQGGGGSEITNIRDLAQDVWSQLTSQGLTPIPIPDGVIGRDAGTRQVHVPAGRPEIVQPGLFDSEGGYAVRFGTSVLRFDTAGERDYCFTLAFAGVRGDVQMPIDEHECSRIAVQIRGYFQEVTRGLDRAVSDLTSDHDLQHRIVREGMRRIIQG